MATVVWYHRDISRVQAEDLLARAGRDGSFLVRDSESVPGAYALCLLFQRHVHTYRILPDSEGLLAVQTSQGVQANCFRTLGDLVLGYQQPHKGLVAPLLYPVGREVEPGDESSDGDDEKPVVAWMSGSIPPPASVGTPTGPMVTPGPQHLLLQRLQDLTVPSMASDVVALLKEYLRIEFPQDLENLRRGGTELRNLQRMLGTVCEDLHSEIDLTLSSLETLAKVFDHPTCPLYSPRAQGADLDLDSLVCKISALCSLLSTLEKKVLKALQDAVTNHNLASQPAPPPEPAPTPKSHQAHTCPLLSGEGCSTLSHDRILQLVKYQSSPVKLRMVVDSHRNPPRELLFESARKREGFCQLLQLMKGRHSQHSEPDIISVFVGTWNMGGSPPPRSLDTWVTCQGLGRVQDESTAALPHDIYAFGTQENTQGEREWAEQARVTLRSVTHIDFKLVALQSLWNIRLAVFVKPEHENRVSHVNTASVKTGLANTLGNKGAVGVSFLFNGTSFGFVNCHLTSGTEKTLRRNQNFQDILRLLSLGDRQLSAFDISLRFTHLFWCGDLNYRLDLDVQDILRHVSKREFSELMCADQLTRERHKRKAFLNFNEEQIVFPPTYRYERGSRDCYLWQKYKTTGVRVNVPSWCDRVLWKSYPETHICCTSYGCTDDIITSDHSPVFATFQVGVTSQFISKTDPGTSGERAWIETECVEAIVKTSSKAKFFIEFHSYCFEEFRRSGENDVQSCEVPGFLKLGWSFKHMPKLVPIVSDMEYLQDQHLLLSVKSCDGFESYGECCVALRTLIGGTADEPRQFETFLTHRGEEMGSIRGRVRVHVPKERRRVREKTYEWFCFEKDDKASVKGPVSSPASRAPTVGVPAAAAPPVSAPPTSAPSSYTNPAYFIFEGVPILRRVEEDPAPPRRDPQVVWSRDSALQLPRLSGRSQNERPPRRSDFTEIEIPGCLPQFQPPSPRQPQPQPQPSSSYQLFPSQDNLHPIHSPRASPNSCLHPEDRVSYKDTQRDQRGLYVNPLGLPKDMPRPYKENARKDRPRMHQERPLSVRKSPSLYPYVSTRVPHREATVPWVVERPQQGPTGDNSLTALQIAKSLSEVDFQPMDRAPSSSHKMIGRKSDLGYEMAIATERAYCWEKEVSVLHGAPETVRELLHTLGLQRYTQGLSLNGWDDLDYFSGITEEDLRAAGVNNPSHRRRILENLPRIWD
ncbi:hypothetical protein AGOR_G00068660 [Albula goreensis]|uniref:phosphatidylinositol-3,4,5-trisphosphate 5-phosphatase n=1 Tax=Albula goreensis TaxID=1534307 RepID=A0A8T3DPD9_9TELE|nr:hypothetical protein AGOR_G00068660 [Albula goreensis]